MVDADKTQKTHRPIVSQRRRQTWMTTLLGAAILISGGGIGFGAAMAYLSKSKTNTAKAQLPPGKVAHEIAAKMAKTWELNDGQKNKIREIMTSRIASLRTIRKKAMEESVAIHAEIADEMQKILTPDQYEQWEKKNEELRKRAKYPHHPRGRRGDRDRRGEHDTRGKHNESEMFKRHDKDQNGEITQDELKKIPGYFQKLLQQADTNGDGKIDREEHKRMKTPEGSGRMRKPYDRPGPGSRPRSRPEPELGPGHGPGPGPGPSSAPAPDISMLEF